MHGSGHGVSTSQAAYSSLLHPCFSLIGMCVFTSARLWSGEGLAQRAQQLYRPLSIDKAVRFFRHFQHAREALL